MVVAGSVAFLMKKKRGPAGKNLAHFVGGAVTWSALLCSSSTSFSRFYLASFLLVDLCSVQFGVMFVKSAFKDTKDAIINCTIWCGCVNHLLQCKDTSNTPGSSCCAQKLHITMAWAMFTSRKCLLETTSCLQLKGTVDHVVLSNNANIDPLARGISQITLPGRSPQHYSSRQRLQLLQ